MASSFLVFIGFLPSKQQPPLLEFQSGGLVNS